MTTFLPHLCYNTIVSINSAFNKPLVFKKILSVLSIFVTAFLLRDFIILYVFTMNRALANFIFILSVLLFAVWYFRSYLVFSKTIVVQFTRYGGFVLLHLTICLICLQYLSPPIGPFDNSQISFLSINPFFIFVKPVDVLLQHVFILVLVKKLREYGLSFWRTVGVMAVVFGGVHLLQTFRTTVLISLPFFIFSLIVAYVFPKLIFVRKNGFVFNAMIHLLAYDVITLYFWGVY